MFLSEFTAISAFKFIYIGNLYCYEESLSTDVILKTGDRTVSAYFKSLTQEGKNYLI